MDTASRQFSKRRAPWASILLHGVLALVLVVVGLVPGSGLPAAQAAGVLTITDLTGAYAVYDHNKPTTSPGVFMAEAKVCNTGTEELRDVTVYIGNGTTPGTFNPVTVGGVTYRLEMLDKVIGGDTDDATRNLGTLAVGACVYVYWAIDYPTPALDLSGTALPFTIWGQGKTPLGSTVSATPVNDTVILRSSQSASANKIAIDTPEYTISPAGPYSIGQQVKVCYPSVDFGVIGSGDNNVNDFWFQPVGSDTFNPDVLRLVKTEATLQSTKCPGSTYTYTDITYFSTINDGDWDGLPGAEACAANSQQVHGQYCYTFVAIGPGSSDLQSYQQASSGNIQKYNGDYGITVLVTTNDTCTVGLAKSADKDNVLQFEELKYTTQFTNLTTASVGAPPATTLQILDAIPSNTQYKLGTASCTGGTVYYSTDGGASYTSTQPASQPPYVTNLKCVLNTALAGSGTGTLSYTVIAQDSNGVTAAPATSNFAGAQCSASQGVSTTPVTLSYFFASRSGETVRFEWSTATETGNVGFNLYSVGSGGRERVNAELIPSHVVDSLEPQHYVFAATGVDGERFFVEDVDLLGRTQHHGPFVVGNAYGTRVEPEPIDWPAIRAEHDAKASARATSSAAQATGGEAGVAEESDAGKGASASAVGVLGPIQLRVQRDGLYRVTYEALLGAGFDLAGAKAAELALTNRGTPVAIDVQSSGPKFGPGAYLEFYGEALDTLYTDTNAYVLEVNRALAERASLDSTAPSDSAPLEPFYMETVAVEHNDQYSNSSPSGDPWYERRLFASSSPVEASFDLVVDQYAGDSAAQSSLSVRVWGMIDWPRAPDHHLVAMLNETTVADEWFDGISDHPFSLTVPAGVLHEGLNTLKLRLPWDTGSQWDMIAVDRYSVTYPRAFVARDGMLTFQAAGDLFRVEGLPEASAVVYRLDDDGLAKLTQLQIDGGSGAYSVTFAGSGSDAKYFVSTEAALSVPAIEAGRPATDITSGTASYVMIAHPDFVEGLAPLVAARQGQGYTVRVVNVEDVYAQFGHGIFDAQAVRDYITYAANHMDTQYFLLVGGDTYDYRDYLDHGTMSFIPSLYAPTGPWVSFAPVDPLYTDLDGDGMPDRAIGRFPVRSAAELDALVAKTLAYGSKDYGATAMFAADAFDGQRSYADDSALFVQQLPADWTVQEAYIDEVGLANARTALIDAMNSGVALTSFVGHSATTVWTFDGLFRVGDAQNLTNIGRPTLVSQYGCWNNWYVATNYDTLAHGLLVSGLQGAAATLGPSTLADSSAEAALGQHLTSRLVEPGMTVGAAIQAAKADLLNTGEGSADMLLGWVLLGDPTLMVQP